MSKPFSVRQGFRGLKPVQVDSVDNALRTAIWNTTYDYISNLRYNDKATLNSEGDVVTAIWRAFMKFPTEKMPIEIVKFFVVFNAWYCTKERKWYMPYEYVEFLYNIPICRRATHERQMKKAFADSVNVQLETELSGFRFVKGMFAPITSKEELAEIKKAASITVPSLEPVTTHLTNALALFSMKPNPDYRNSMKESISAVESLCKLISGMEQTLSPTLENVTKHLKLNAHLRDGFIQIYKYTSSEAGIRHGSSDNKVLEQEDARFLLIACSAIVNLIIEKARKANKLPK